jgi:phasin family protein
MLNELNEFIDEQTKGLRDMAANLRKSRVAAARKAALESAARIKALNGRVRGLARSGVRLTSISHGTVQSLIELQSEIVNAALGDAASQLERVAYTGSVRDLAREQAEVLQAARERIVNDVARAMKILRQAARDARKVAEHEAAPAAPKRKSAARKAGRTVRKAKRKVSGTARRRRAAAR